MTHCMGNLLEEPEFSARASEGRHCAENKKTATQEGSFQFAISQRSQESKARRAPLTVSPAITHIRRCTAGRDRRLRSAVRLPLSHPAPAAALPHKLHTHSVRRAVWHTHTHTVGPRSWRASGTAATARPHDTRTAHAPPQRPHGGFPSRPACPAQLHGAPSCAAHPPETPCHAHSSSHHVGAVQNVASTLLGA
jgi:hypothetical protein